jgi:hypothetical protein
MKKQRLEQLALQVLAPLEFLPYEEARKRATAKRMDTDEIGEGDHRFQVEVQYLFDVGQSGAVRILVSVDDGGLTAFFPVTKDTLISEPPE